ncbi:hypothetical protein IWZ03DRAFT_298206, partial [Phyllosticta citriasiana]
PPELKSRVSYQAQEIFTEQKFKGADVYFFSKTFHDWSDEYCIQIRRNLVPAMNEGSRVVINEWGVFLSPLSLMEKLTDATLRFTGFTMLCAHNGKERTKEEWKQLLKAADERF